MAVAKPMVGVGNPEGRVTGPVDAIYLDSESGTFYAKEVGDGNTGWIAMPSGGSGDSGSSGSDSIDASPQFSLPYFKNDNGTELVGDPGITTDGAGSLSVAGELATGARFDPPGIRCTQNLTVTHGGLNFSGDVMQDDASGINLQGDVACQGALYPSGMLWVSGDTYFAPGAGKGSVQFSPRTFALLPAAKILGTDRNGLTFYCKDADTPATPGAVATSAGDKAGALVVFLRGAWRAF